MENEGNFGVFEIKASAINSSRFPYLIYESWSKTRNNMLQKHQKPPPDKQKKIESNLKLKWQKIFGQFVDSFKLFPFIFEEYLKMMETPQ